MALIIEEEFAEFMDHMEDGVFNNIHRVLADYQNPLEKYNEPKFLRRFRFSKIAVVTHLLPLLTENSESNRGLPIPAILKLTAALRFYATGSFQMCFGELSGLSQPSSCRIVKEVSSIFSDQFHNIIRFPETLEERAETKEIFFAMHGFPNVLGCVDCTHIGIKSPGGENAEFFRNQKSWMSINVQAVAGPQLQFFDTVVRWPGSAHDSRIFDNSSLKFRLEERDLQTNFLLGDSGYPQKKYLYTPVPDPQTRSQLKYNKAHKSTRATVERAFGVLKKRFPCLAMKLGNKLPTTLKIIVACFCLHNLGRLYNPYDFPLEIDPQIWEDLIVDAPAVRETDRGRIIREMFILRNFTN